MTDQSNILWQFQRRLSRASKLENCRQYLEECLAHFDIHVYAFTYYAYHPKSSNKLKYDIAADFLKPWHEHYIEQGYEQIDSTLLRSNKMNLPVIWTLEEQLAKAASNLERQMREDSIAYGVERGVSIPVHGPEGDFAELVVQQRFGEICLQDSVHLQYTLLAIGHIYYSYISRYVLKEMTAPTSSNKYSLSKRELQCLTLAAQNKSVAEISVQLSISDRTVNFHMQNINKKLGTKNKYQSISKALQEQLLVL